MRLHVPPGLHADRQRRHQALEVGDVDRLLLLLVGRSGLTAPLAIEQDDEEDGDCHEQPASHVAQDQEEVVAQGIDFVGDVNVLLRRRSQVQHEYQLFWVFRVGLVGQSEGSLDVEHVDVGLRELAAAGDWSNGDSLVNVGGGGEGTDDIDAVGHDHVDVEPQFLLYLSRQHQVGRDAWKESDHGVAGERGGWVTAVEDEAGRTPAVTARLADGHRTACWTRTLNQIWQPSNEQPPPKRIHQVNNISKITPQLASPLSKHTPLTPSPLPSIASFLLVLPLHGDQRELEAVAGAEAGAFSDDPCILTFEFSVVFILKTIMKESRLLPQNLIPAKPPQNSSQNSNIRSLKAIMNQGRIPLAQYINHKTAGTPYAQHLSYFDKMKAMFKKGEPITNRDMKTDTPMEEEMEVEEHKIDEYVPEQVRKEVAANKKSTLHYNHLRKERSKSMNAKTRPHPQPPHPSHLATETIRRVPVREPVQRQGKSQTEIEQMDSKNGKNEICMGMGKTVKKQRVNYTKFTKLYSGEGIATVELQELLGCGANASVRLGRETKTGSVFAVKVYEKYKLVQAAKKKRVVRETQILTKLSHPNVIKVLHSFEDKRQIHILFEYVHNAQTLQDYLRSRLFDIPAPTKRALAVQTAQAIAYLHSAGVSHRDIKTDNIMVNEEGVVKLIDFGFATTAARGETHCGTPNYMAPELFHKHTQYDPFKVDVWAFGILLFYLHEGSYPFKGYCEKELIKNMLSAAIPFKRSEPAIRELVGWMLRLDPAERPHAHQLLSKLNQSAF